MIKLPTSVKRHKASVKDVNTDSKGLVLDGVSLGRVTENAVHINLNRLNKYLCGKKGVEKIVQDEKLKKFALQQKLQGR